MYPYTNEPETKVKATQVDAVPANENDYILDMLTDALEDEMHDARYYKELSEKVSDKNDKDMLRKLSMDELKHYKYFKDIYFSLTGENAAMPEIDVNTNFTLTDSFVNGLKGEIAAVEMYRKIMSSILNLEIRDLMYEIITDEQNHAAALNYLYAKHIK